MSLRINMRCGRDLVVAAAFLLATLNSGSLRAGPDRLFHGAGIVTGTDAGSGSITIRHQAIEGLMPAMEMAFQADPPALAGGVKAGDAVEFDLVGQTYTIKRLKDLGPPKP